MAEHYGWDLDKIRNLNLKDFHAHLKICLAKELTDKEFQALLAGAIPSDKESPKSKKGNLLDGIPNKEQRMGKISHNNTENVMNFSSKIRQVKIKKPTN